MALVTESTCWVVCNTGLELARRIKMARLKVFRIVLLVGLLIIQSSLEVNRKALETLFRYFHEHGLSSRELTVEDLFYPSALAFKE